MHPLFGTKHLILIGVCLCAIVALFFYARERKFKDVCKVCFYCGIISEIIKIFYYIVQNEETHGGVLPKTDLPFHLCSIQILFFSFLYVSQNEKLKRFLISFMLPSCLFGGIAAILIATDSSRNGLWIITFQYFAYHVMLVAFSLYLLSSKELKFTAKDYVNCLKFLLILMFVAVYVNSIVDDGSGKNQLYVRRFASAKRFAVLEREPRLARIHSALRLLGAVLRDYVLSQAHYRIFQNLEN